MKLLKILLPLLIISLTSNTFASGKAKKAKSAPAKAAVSKEFVFNPNISVQQTLKMLNEKRDKARVYVTLKSGKQYSGKIGLIGQSSFILSSIDGKEYYDALISYANIEALEIQMRGFPKAPEQAPENEANQ